MMYVWLGGIGIASIFEPEIALVTAGVTALCLLGLWVGDKFNGN
jgi:hypothetical protein